MMIRAVFFGTPEFAVPTLSALIEAKGVEIPAALTQPDRPAGRGKKLQPSPVKILAQEHGLDLLQPEKLKDPETLPWLERHKPDVIVVVAYGGFVPKTIREAARFGCVNLHPSLLPMYRGAAPIQWAIARGDTRTGNTTMYLDKGWDTGDIIYQEEEPILPSDTYGTLAPRLAEKGARLVVRSLLDIAEGKAPRVPQPEECEFFAPLINKEDARIDWTKSAGEIHNLIRGFNPFPGAFTSCEGQRWKVLRTEVIQETPPRPGTLVTTAFNTIRIAAADAIVEILELQPAGKRAMSASEFLRGHKPAEGAVCE